MRIDLSEGLPHYPSAGTVGAMCGHHVLGSESKRLGPIEANLPTGVTFSLKNRL